VKKWAVIVTWAQNVKYKSIKALFGFKLLKCSKHVLAAMHFPEGETLRKHCIGYSDTLLCHLTVVFNMLNNRTTKHGYGKARLVTTARNMYLIKVCDDLIEYAQTLHSLVIGGEFRVELGEVRD